MTNSTFTQDVNIHLGIGYDDETHHVYARNSMMTKTNGDRQSEVSAMPCVRTDTQDLNTIKH